MRMDTHTDKRGLWNAIQEREDRERALEQRKSGCFGLIFWGVIALWAVVKIVQALSIDAA